MVEITGIRPGSRVVYLLIKTIHVLMAIISVGSMVVLPVLAYMQPKTVSDDWLRAVNSIDRIISVSGFALVFSGFALVSVTGWGLLFSPWLKASFVLIVLGLVSNKLRGSAWIESRMRRYAPGRQSTVLMLGIETAMFLTVAALMTIKPV